MPYQMMWNRTFASQLDSVVTLPFEFKNYHIWSVVPKTENWIQAPNNYCSYVRDLGIVVKACMHDLVAWSIPGPKFCSLGLKFRPSSFLRCLTYLSLGVGHSCYALTLPKPVSSVEITRNMDGSEFSGDGYADESKLQTRDRRCQKHH